MIFTSLLLNNVWRLLIWEVTNNMKNMENNTKYDNLTLEEVIALYKNFGDIAIIHNGHVIGFEKDGEEKLWR